MAAMLTFDELIERFTHWAAQEEDVRAALILGSRARTDHPADEWSDLDVLVFARHPEKFIQAEEWATALAPSWLTFVERTGDGKSWERRILYEGGLDVDVAIDPEEWLDGMLQGIQPDVGDVLRRGVKVLADKDGKLAQIQALPLPAAGMFQKPTAREFANATSDFWYHTLWSAKHLRRGELWWGKSGVDMHMKGLLKDMLEWHARATQGEHFDTWMRGRFLEEWADPRALEQMRGAFGHYDIGDTARALRETMDLYRWLEDETAVAWGYFHPQEGEEAACQKTLELLEPLI
jgi:aminoglycoside 6-adenylyltransferase